MKTHVNSVLKEPDWKDFIVVTALDWDCIQFLALTQTSCVTLASHLLLSASSPHSNFTDNNSSLLHRGGVKINSVMFVGCSATTGTGTSREIDTNI